MYEDDTDMYAMWCEATESTQAYDDAAVLRLLAEVAELRKDKARLDWLGRVGPMQSDLCVAYASDPPWVNGDGVGRYRTMRLAIDAAMERKA